MKTQGANSMESIETLKSLALTQCIKIRNDYTKEEVARFALESVCVAWQIGDEYLELRRKLDREMLKNFKL